MSGDNKEIPAVNHQLVRMISHETPEIASSDSCGGDSGIKICCSAKLAMDDAAVGSSVLGAKYRIPVEMVQTRSES